jgi:hypothetical protein
MSNGGPEPQGDERDPVAAVVEEVRDDLAERRRTGELPDLPADELDRHFSGVVEAVDGALAGQPPVSSAGLTEAAALTTWRPGGGLRNRAVGVLLRPLSRLVGAVVRRQVGAFTVRAADVVTELVDRQNRMQRFLARAHLDRLRSAEYRIARLEREVESLRDRRDGGG